MCVSASPRGEGARSGRMRSASAPLIPPPLQDLAGDDDLSGPRWRPRRIRRRARRVELLDLDALGHAEAAEDLHRLVDDAREVGLPGALSVWRDHTWPSAVPRVTRVRAAGPSRPGRPRVDERAAGEASTSESAFSASAACVSLGSCQSARPRDKPARAGLRGGAPSVEGPAREANERGPRPTVRAEDVEGPAIATLKPAPGSPMRVGRAARAAAFCSESRRPPSGWGPRIHFRCVLLRSVTPGLSCLEPSDGGKKAPAPGASRCGRKLTNDQRCPPFEIQVSPRPRIAFPPRSAPWWRARDPSEARLRLGQAKARCRARDHTRQHPALERLGAEQRHRPRAQSLHGEGEVGEAVVVGQRLAGEAQRADVERSRPPHHRRRVRRRAASRPRRGGAPACGRPRRRRRARHEDRE